MEKKEIGMFAIKVFFQLIKRTLNEVWSEAMQENIFKMMGNFCVP
jgi:hypothetical protein